ncbi:MAG: acylphosphatase [Atopobiaceae bacterium]|nr:acylphosphatase [Atopobiaceae bacterium]
MKWFWQRKDAKPKREKTIPQGAVRKKLRYTGRVQAVGFRFTSQAWAEQHGLTGWVTNLVDGDVMLEVQGTPAQIDAFLAEVDHESVRKGAFIRAKLVQCDEIEPTPEDRFVIRNINF